MSFLKVNSTENLDWFEWNGVIGLAPTTQRTFAELFMYQIDNANLVDKLVFSITSEEL